MISEYGEDGFDLQRQTSVLLTIICQDQERPENIAIVNRHLFVKDHFHDANLIEKEGKLVVLISSTPLGNHDSKFRLEGSIVVDFPTKEDLREWQNGDSKFKKEFIATFG